MKTRKLKFYSAVEHLSKQTVDNYTTDFENQLLEALMPTMQTKYWKL